MMEMFKYIRCVTKTYIIKMVLILLLAILRILDSNIYCFAYSWDSLLLRWDKVINLEWRTSLLLRILNATSTSDFVKYFCWAFYCCCSCSVVQWVRRTLPFRSKLLQSYLLTWWNLQLRIDRFYCRNSQRVLRIYLFASHLVECQFIIVFLELEKCSLKKLNWNQRMKRKKMKNVFDCLKNCFFSGSFPEDVIALVSETHWIAVVH